MLDSSYHGVRSPAADQPLATPLYRRVLGPAWCEVHPAVQQAHLEGDCLRRSGIFRVRSGSSLMARVLRAMLRLPAAVDAARSTLLVTRREQGELWLRTFGNRRLVTYQTDAGGALREGVRMIEILFQLDVEQGAIVYRQTGAALRLGRATVPLPHRLWPRVEAREMAAENNSVHSSVRVTLPLVGMLIAYDGYHQAEPLA